MKFPLIFTRVWDDETGELTDPRIDELASRAVEGLTHEQHGALSQEEFFLNVFLDGGAGEPVVLNDESDVEKMIEKYRRFWD